MKCANKKPEEPGYIPASGNTQKKKDSWNMAKKLYLERRITLDTALYGLQSSGHTKKEAAEWLREIGR